MPTPAEPTRRQPPRVRARAIARALVATAAAAAAATASAGAQREYAIKAAFLYNFARYVQWPQPAPSGERGPLTIGVLGPDPFGPILDEIAASKTIGARKLVVRRFATLDRYTPCDILFVSSPMARQVEAVLARTEGSHVLVVGDSAGLAEGGVAINFYIADNKVHFEINRRAARRARLKISSKLLRLARIVAEEDSD